VGVEPPGTGGYSTTNYIVLQAIAEKLTGTPLSEAIETRIATPLGLKQTALPPNDDSSLSEPSTRGVLADACVQELQAYGAKVKRGQDASDWSVSAAKGGGAMQSNLKELGVWAASTSDPVKGRTLVIATNACGAGLQMYGFVAGVYPDAGVIEALSAKPEK
jgi:D-alanyl-D-alanine carboxypeptidase